jgi:CRP-like cAMP-binding protein
MKPGALGKEYHDGAAIVRQGEVGDCMYVIQDGKVEVLQEKEDNKMRLMVLGKGDIFGEMALFEQEVRSATVRALGEVRILTIDKKTFLQKIHEDPSIAFNTIRKMSQRIRELNAELVRIKSKT